jgi:AMP nucleosidase
VVAAREGHPGARDLVACRDPDEALARVQALYAAAADGIRARLARFAAGAREADPPAASYPYVGIDVPAGALNIDARVAYGAVLDPGT